MKAIDILRLTRAITGCNIMMRSPLITSPYRLAMNITNQCNSRCLTCNIWKTYPDNPKTLKNELNTDEIVSVLKYLPDLLWLQLGGGEPFLRKDLPEIIKGATESCPSLIVVDTSTNGLLPEQVENTTLEILKNTKLPLFAIGVSLDGIPEINDSIRGVSGGWQKSIESYKRLSKIASQYKNFSTHINYTISNHNNGRLKEFLELIEDEGIKASDVSVSIAHQGLAFLNNGTEGIIITEIEKAIKDLELLSNQYRFRGISTTQLSRLFKKIFLNLAPRYLKGSEKQVITCAACSASCFIDPYGDVFPCTVWGKKMGNIREEKLNTIWRSKEAKEIRAQIKTGGCPNCWSGCESWVSTLQNLPLSLRHLL